MKREGNIENYGWFVHAADPGLILCFDEPDLSGVEDKESTKSLLEAIYAPDPRTGFPTGDIACYVSDKTSPAVKEFIKANLMIDVSSARLPSVPADVDDDIVFQLARQPEETQIEYGMRISELMKSDLRFIEKCSRPVSSPDVKVDE